MNAISFRIVAAAKAALCVICPIFLMALLVTLAAAGYTVADAADNYLPQFIYGEGTSLLALFGSLFVGLSAMAVFGLSMACLGYVFFCVVPSCVRGLVDNVEDCVIGHRRMRYVR